MARASLPRARTCSMVRQGLAEWMTLWHVAHTIAISVTGVMLSGCSSSIGTLWWASSRSALARSAMNTVWNLAEGTETGTGIVKPAFQV